MDCFLKEYKKILNGEEITGKHPYKINVHSGSTYWKTTFIEIENKKEENTYRFYEEDGEYKLSYTSYKIKSINIGALIIYLDSTGTNEIVDKIYEYIKKRYNKNDIDMFLKAYNALLSNLIRLEKKIKEQEDFFYECDVVF